MNTTRFRPFLLLFMCAALTQGCNSTTMPSAAPSDAPAPQTVVGMTRDRTSYRFLKWNEGLTVLLVDHCDASNMSGEYGSGKPYRCKGTAYWSDRDAHEWKVGYEWQMETSDGQTGLITINNVAYDLSKGAIFRIDISGGKATVKQFDHDLSNIQPDTQSCDHFVTASPELSAMLSSDFAAPARSDMPLTDLEVYEAAWDDTAHRPNEHKVSGTLKTQLRRGSFSLNASLYRDGKRQSPIFGISNGIPLQDSNIEVRFVATATDSKEPQPDVTSSEASRLSLTLSLRAAGGDETTAGPSKRDVPRADFDTKEISGLVVFDDRPLPEHPDKSIVIPLAAWITGAGSIPDYTAEDFDMDEFALKQLKAGKGDNRAVLVLYLTWRPPKD